MRTASYNCPCCGAPLAFDGATGKLECTACGNAFEPEALEMLNASESDEQIFFEHPKESFQASARTATGLRRRLRNRSAM